MSSMNENLIRALGRLSLTAGALLLLLPLAGCTHAPNFNILGSYFPAWLLCIIVGTAASSIVYWWLLRKRWDRYLTPSIIVYPCLAVLFACTLWLLLFS